MAHHGPSAADDGVAVHFSNADQGQQVSTAVQRRPSHADPWGLKFSKADEGRLFARVFMPAIRWLIDHYSSDPAFWGSPLLGQAQPP